MAVEKTLSIIKPDAVGKNVVGQIILLQNYLDKEQNRKVIAMAQNANGLVGIEPLGKRVAKAAVDTAPQLRPGTRHEPLPIDSIVTQCARQDGPPESRMASTRSPKSGMSFALASRRGAALNCRLAVNGIQKALRSFGVTLRRSDKLFPRSLFSLRSMSLDGSALCPEI